MMMHGENLNDLLCDAGFVDVRERKRKVEIGDWGPGLFHSEVY